MGQERKHRGGFFELNCNDILTILCAAAVPIALGIYTAITYQQEQEQQQKMQQLSLNQSAELRRDKIYDNFLKNVYNLDKNGYLEENKDPWAFANAYYRAAHRQLDPTRKGDVLQFLKERQLIGRNNCTETCGYKSIPDIIRLNELSFDDMELSSQTGTLTRLNLKCVSFDQVSMNNVRFIFANLDGGSFSKSRLVNIDFGNSSLRCVNFNGTEFENVNFGESDLTGVYIDKNIIPKLNLTEKQKDQLAQSSRAISKLITTTTKTTIKSASTAAITTRKVSTTKIATTITTVTRTTTTTTTTNSGVSSFSGVQLNFSPASLATQWSKCYSAEYGDPMGTSNLPSILSRCNGSKLLLGCRPVGNSLLTVAAMGNRADVLYDCGTILNCTKPANDVEWYFSDVYSWGFARSGDSVNRSSCDASTTNAIYRLCWHTENNGGHRCGNTTFINSATDWEKVIYHMI